MTRSSRRRSSWFPPTLLLAALLLALLPTHASAQVGNFGPGFFTSGSSKSAVGFGLWYGASKIRLDAPQSSTSNEVKGLSDALPPTLTSAGPSLGVSFGSWGINAGYNVGQADVGAYADVNQTPGNTADDVYVITARRVSRTLSVIINPLRWLFLGYGTESGTMEFTETSGTAGTVRKLPFSNSFYSFGLACCFDPSKGGFGPIFTFYAKLPVGRGDFTGSEYGAGLGIYR